MAAVVGGSNLLSRAGADPALPPRGAAQLLVDVQTARLDPLSGTVVQHSSLGLPQLPSIGGQGSSDLSSLVSGTHTLRVWYSGPSKARVALLGTLGESDVVMNDRDVWVWSSSSNTATHHVLSAAEAGHRTPENLHQVLPTEITPQRAAERALAAVDPTTVVTTDGTASVAGRRAYELALQPRDHSSLIGQVRIAVDAARHVPLRVQVLPRNSTEPAFEVAFTQVSFDRPADSQFHFAPPPGVTVHQPHESAPTDRAPRRAKGNSVRPSEQTQIQAQTLKPTAVGTGWATIFEARIPQGADAQPGSDARDRDTASRDADGAATQIQRMLSTLPRVSGSWGSGRLLKSSIFSILLTDDGRVLAGAVDADRLLQAAGR